MDRNCVVVVTDTVCCHLVVYDCGGFVQPTEGSTCVRFGTSLAELNHAQQNWLSKVHMAVFTAELTVDDNTHSFIMRFLTKT